MPICTFNLFQLLNLGFKEHHHTAYDHIRYQLNKRNNSIESIYLLVKNLPMLK
jgi:hypothetical protein